jgi:hypothetical protein
MCGHVYLARLPAVLGVVSESTARLCFGGRTRPAACDELVHATLEVKAELIVYVAFHPRL